MERNGRVIDAITPPAYFENYRQSSRVEQQDDLVRVTNPSSPYYGQIIDLSVFESQLAKNTVDLDGRPVPNSMVFAAPQVNGEVAYLPGDGALRDYLTGRPPSEDLGQFLDRGSRMAETDFAGIGPPQGWSPPPAPPSYQWAEQVPEAFGRVYREDIEGQIAAIRAANPWSYNTLPEAFGQPEAYKPQEMDDGNQPEVINSIGGQAMTPDAYQRAMSNWDADNFGFDNFTEGFSADNSMGVGRSGRGGLQPGNVAPGSIVTETRNTPQTIRDYIDQFERGGLTADFSFDEHVAAVSPQTANVALSIAAAIGREPTLNSSYRTEGRNSTLPGAARNSQHMRGNAIDVGLADLTRQEAQAALEAAIAAGGRFVQFYTSGAHMHIDTRPGQSVRLRGPAPGWAQSVVRRADDIIAAAPPPQELQFVREYMERIGFVPGRELPETAPQQIAAPSPDTNIPLSPELTPPAPEVTVTPPDLPALSTDLVSPDPDAARINAQVSAPPTLETPSGFTWDPQPTISGMVPAVEAPPIGGFPSAQDAVPTETNRPPAFDLPSLQGVNPDYTPTFQGVEVDYRDAPTFQGVEFSSPQTAPPDAVRDVPAVGWAPALQGVSPDYVPSLQGVDQYDPTPSFSPDAGVNALPAAGWVPTMQGVMPDYAPAAPPPDFTPRAVEAQTVYQSPAGPVAEPSTGRGFSYDDVYDGTAWNGDPAMSSGFSTQARTARDTFTAPAAPAPDAPAAPTYSPPAPTTPAGAFPDVQDYDATPAAPAAPAPDAPAAPMSFPDPVDLSDVPTAPAPAVNPAPQVPAAVPAAPAPAPAPARTAPAVPAAPPAAPPMTIRGPAGAPVETPSPTAAPRSFDDIARTGSFFDIASFKGDGLPEGVTARDAAVAAANQVGYGGWNDLGFTGGLSGPHPDTNPRAQAWAENFYGNQNFSIDGLPSLSLDPRAEGALTGGLRGGLIGGPVGFVGGGIVGLLDAIGRYDSPLPGYETGKNLMDSGLGGYKVDPNTPIDAPLSAQLGTPAWGAQPGDPNVGGGWNIGNFLSGIFGGAPAAGGYSGGFGGWGDTAGGGRPDPGGYI
jgi:hypothetical protein